MAALLRVLLFAWALGLASDASAQGVIDTCLTVTGSGADLADLTKLVRSELERHPSFRRAERDCRAELAVERLEVGGQVFLTGRMSAQVPHRVLVTGARIDLAVKELLTVVLGQDPVVLLDPEDARRPFSATQGPMRRTSGHWGLSVGQAYLRMPGAIRDMPQLSLSYQRELDVWQVGVQLHTAYWLASSIEAVHPTLTMAVLPELSRFSSARANTAGFVGLGLGVLHQRFEGPVRGERSLRRRVHETGPALSVRVGVEFLRSAQARARVYLEGLLPAFVSRDPRSEVIQAFTPSLTFGAGVVF